MHHKFKVVRYSTMYANESTLLFLVTKHLADLPLVKPEQLFKLQRNLTLPHISNHVAIEFSVNLKSRQHVKESKRQ